MIYNKYAITKQKREDMDIHSVREQLRTRSIYDIPLRVTFYARVSGDSMIEAGINDGDIAVIDRSLDAAQGDLVVAFVDGEFTMKQIDFSHREEGYILLHPANPNYKDIRIEGDETFEVWGVVIWTIRSWRK